MSNKTARSYLDETNKTVYKIGYSYDPYRRLVEAETCNSFKLDGYTMNTGLFYLRYSFRVSNMREAERYLHILLTKYRISHKEFFSEIPDDELKSAIDEVRSLYHP